LKIAHLFALAKDRLSNSEGKKVFRREAGKPRERSLKDGRRRFEEQPDEKKAELGEHTGKNKLKKD